MRRDDDELVDQRRDQARLLGDAGADHGGDHETHGGKCHEVGNERLVHEANAVRVEQAAYFCAGNLDFVRIRIDALETDGGSERAQQDRQHNDDGNQDQEDDDRVGNHVPDFLDTVEKSLHRGLGSGVCSDHVSIPSNENTMHCVLGN